MALTATARGSGSRNTGGETTYTFSPGSNFTAGSRAVLCFAVDNSGTSGAGPVSTTSDTSVIDSLGNVWRYRTQQTRTAASASNDGVSVGIYDAVMQYPLTTSDTITINFTATTVARAYALWELTSNTAGMMAAPQLGDGTGGTGSGTAASGATVRSVATNECVIGVMGAEYGDGTMTEDADATNGSWSASQEASVGGAAATGVEICSQTKVVTGNGAQTYDVTITSADWAVILQVYGESPIEVLRVGTGSRNTAAESSYAITPGRTIRQGRMAVLCVSYDNSGASGADPFTSITDSLGNLWYTASNATQDPGAANAGNSGRIFYSRLTRPLTTSDTITVSFGAVTVARAFALFELDAMVGYRVAFYGNASQAVGASTTPSVTRATGNPAGYLMFGMSTAEHNSAITGSNDTTSGSWSVNNSAGVGTTTGGAQINVQTKYVQSDVSITFANTITSADWTAQIALFAGFKIPGGLPAMGVG